MTSESPKTARRVVFVHHLDTLPAGQDAESQTQAWIYFGTSAEGHFAARSALAGRGREILSGPLVNETVDRYRDELLNFDELLEVKDELLWQSSELAHRNALGGFLHMWCCVIVLERLRSELDEGLLVVVEDPTFFEQLVRREASRGAGAHGSAYAQKQRLRRLASDAQLLRQAVALRVSWLRASSRVLRVSRRLFPTLVPSLDVDVLIASWIPGNTFDPTKLAAGDSYFGLLPESLRANGVRVGWIATPTDWVQPIESILRNIASARDVVVTPDAALGWRDMLWIAGRTLRASARCKGRFVVGGVDLTEFLQDELRREKLSLPLLWALRSYRLGRRLAREFPTGTIVFLFENQPWEKALRLGVRSRQSGIRLVGLMHTPFPSRWFPYFPSRRDIALGQLPDQIGVIGQLWKRQFIAHGYPEERIVVVPAIRYAHLRRLESQGANATVAKRTVVIAGSTGFSDSLELVVKTLTALETLRDVRLVLKLHPRMGGAERFLPAVLTALGTDRLPRQFDVVEGSVSDALAGAGVLLYTATSVAYEALAAGVAPVFVESDVWFDPDSIPAEVDVRSVVRTPAEIRAVVVELLGEDSVQASMGRIYARKFMADALEPSDPEPLARLLAQRAARNPPN